MTLMYVSKLSRFWSMLFKTSYGVVTMPMIGTVIVFPMSLKLFDLST